MGKGEGVGIDYGEGGLYSKHEKFKEADHCWHFSIENVKEIVVEGGCYVKIRGLILDECSIGPMP